MEKENEESLSLCRERLIRAFVFCFVLALLEILSSTQAIRGLAAEFAARNPSKSNAIHKGNSSTTLESTEEDTSVIILSSLIPSHPSIWMINETYHSLHHLIGLSSTAPLFLPVDGSPEGTSTDDRDRLAQYIINLKSAFNETHHHIIASSTHLHIAGNIKQAHDLITTPYIYIIQHDFPFQQNINHTAIIKSMREYPDVLRLVRFNKRRNMYLRRDRYGGNCTYHSYPVNHINGIHFWKTSKWSDNNHLTTWAYYDEVFKVLGNLKRAPEDPMMNHAVSNCSYWGPFVYGQIGDGPYLRHLDGRHVQATKEHII
jgi:hypothetical protein